MGSGTDTEVGHHCFGLYGTVASVSVIVVADVELARERAGEAVGFD